MEQLSFDFIEGQSYGEYYTDKIVRKWAVENGYNHLLHRLDILSDLMSKSLNE